MEDRVHRTFPELPVIIHPSPDVRVQELGNTNNAFVGQPNDVQFFHLIGNSFLRTRADGTVITEE